MAFCQICGNLCSVGGTSLGHWYQNLRINGGTLISKISRCPTVTKLSVFSYLTTSQYQARNVLFSSQNVLVRVCISITSLIPLEERHNMALLERYPGAEFSDGFFSENPSNASIWRFSAWRYLWDILGHKGSNADLDSNQNISGLNLLTQTQSHTDKIK